MKQARNIAWDECYKEERAEINSYRKVLLTLASFSDRSVTVAIWNLADFSTINSKPHDLFMYYFSSNQTNNLSFSRIPGSKKKALPVCGGKAQDSSRLGSTPGPAPDRWKTPTCAFIISKCFETTVVWSHSKHLVSNSDVMWLTCSYYKMEHNLLVACFKPLTLVKFTNC